MHFNVIYLSWVLDRTQKTADESLGIESIGS